jgi:hypothetical protein
VTWRNKTNEYLLIYLLLKMSEEEASFDASICKKESDVNCKRNRDEEEEKRAQQVKEFYAKLKKNARAACSVGNYKTTIFFTRHVSQDLHADISRLLEEKHFKYRWDSYKGDHFCVVSWGSSPVEKQ